MGGACGSVLHLTFPRDEERWRTKPWKANAPGWHEKHETAVPSKTVRSGHVRTDRFLLKKVEKETYFDPCFELQKRVGGRSSRSEFICDGQNGDSHDAARCYCL